MSEHVESVGRPDEEPVPLTPVADEIDLRHQQLCEWAAELAERREELRLYRARQEGYVAADRERARQLRTQAERLRDAARQERQKARTLHARFLARMKRKWAAERQALAAERAEVDRYRQQAHDEIARERAECDRFTAEATAYQRRLQDAWELLAEGQRRLLADRQEAERTLARREEVLNQRAAELAAQSQALEAGRERVEARVQELLGEIARLEARAVHARIAVQNLEDRRAALEAGLAPVSGLAVADPFSDRVSLTELPPGGIDEVLAGLAAERHAVTRDRAALQQARSELERRAADLADQRTVLAEQVATLVVARQMWQTAEHRTVSELETLARGLGSREMALAAQERDVERAAERNQQREAELTTLRQRLEEWQSALASHEAAAAAERERWEADRTATREHLTRWETALRELCRKWSTARKRDLATLREELERWATARQSYLARLAELDRQREELATLATQVAGTALAVEEVQQHIQGEQGRLARRKLRIARRRWERHFAQLGRELIARQEAATAESATAEERLRKLARTLTEVSARQAAVTEAEQRAEAELLTRTRELDERAVILSIEAARAERTGQALQLARSEADEVVLSLRESEPPRALTEAERPRLRAA